MPLKYEELRVLQASEAVADGIWKQVIPWDPFIRDVVGKQLAEAADSIGANIAEAFGRFHYGEKVQFLYYARGSLFETKYWLNRALERELLSAAQGQSYASDLTELARQLNAFLSSLKTLRRNNKARRINVSEAHVEYNSDSIDGKPLLLFTTEELEWLETVQNT